MSGGPVRSTVTDAQRRRAYLKHVYEEGFRDGLAFAEEVGRYKEDEEARPRYLIGYRIGRRERNR